MNTICFTGNIGNDAEVRYTKDGAAVTSFNVALTSGYGDKKKTTWMRCTLFGDRGPKVNMYLLKGTQVGVTGEFSMDVWSDKEGNERQTPSVRVNDVTLLGSKAQGDSNSPKKEKPAAAAAEVTFDDLDIPF